ncbi:SDR family oxidoreductase [Mycobacterium sp. UM_CSW]|uniref:SDR family oxidoreductase n=1 Tax=Mycobacterium sp. UM_CSW TaxID=1370119 RepID=UPI0003FE9E83|nr:SDR family oxidoreductase [Mycobacterium sp. UM_CSW]
MTAPHVIGRSDAISSAIAASLKSVVHDLDESTRPQSGEVVIVLGVDPVLEPTSFNTLNPTDWHRFAEQPMRQVLSALQRSYVSMRNAGGRIVLVLPTIGMTGGPYLVACTTALEGIRAMTKSAARQWASQNVIVNMIAAPLHLFAPNLSASANHITAPAIDDNDKLVESIVETTRFLLKREVTGLVGETVIVDGGAVMLP